MFRASWLLLLEKLWFEFGLEEEPVTPETELEGGVYVLPVDEDPVVERGV